MGKVEITRDCCGDPYTFVNVPAEVAARIPLHMRLETLDGYDFTLLGNEEESRLLGLPCDYDYFIVTVV